MSISGASPVSFLQTLSDALNYIGNKIQDVRKVQNYYETNSISEITKLARVEPLTIISRDLISFEELPSINECLLNLFISYYLQAVSLIANVNSAKIIKTLDALNPDRDSSGFFMSLENIKQFSSLVQDSYEYKLPKLGMEANDDFISSRTEQQNVTKVLSETTANAVGKVVEINFTTRDSTDTIDNSGNTKKVPGKNASCSTIPVSFRITPAVINNQSIMHILALKTDDNTLVERFHAWRAGRIRFMSDIIFCQDLIDEHKKALMHDETGAYSEIIRRANNAKKYGMLTHNPSMASASNLFVISDQVASELETKLGGKLSNYKIRQKAFENTYAMILVVVDREWDRVVFYIRGIEASSDISFKELKGAKKDSGTNIIDMLKALNMGSAPSF